MTGLQALDPQFDRFLYAQLCEHDEMTLSVLSALTRQNIDPWHLAARLSLNCQRAQAVKTLARIVQEPDSGRWSASEANETAVRLIGLLPSQTSFGSAPPSMKNLKGYLILHGIFWGTLALYAGNPQQTDKNYNDSSAANRGLQARTIVAPTAKHRLKTALSASSGFE
jgi:hypothetical protein